MFLIEEIQATRKLRQFKDDLSLVRQSLASYRFGQRLLFQGEAIGRLSYFVECVLASAPLWDGENAQKICSEAAEIAEMLSFNSNLKEDQHKRMRIRSALLYELADSPALTSAVIRQNDMTGVMGDFFARKKFFGFLNLEESLALFKENPNLSDSSAIDLALSSDAVSLAEYEQGATDFKSEKLVSNALIELAKLVALELNATEINAVKNIIMKRSRLATRSNINNDLFQLTKTINFPSELWSSQAQAIREGLLDSSLDSWGFAAPTGTGKTFITRLLILKELLEKPGKKILYIVPSRALVHEISSKLTSIFNDTAYKVVALSPQLVDLNPEEENHLEDSTVVVLTPEKADLLLRLGLDFMNAVSLVVVDEAHHIEANTRGVLLEMYLWRLKNYLKGNARTVFLSAVAPNIGDLANWMGKKNRSLTIGQRSTRMRAGVFRIKGEIKRQGWIDYSDGTSVCVIESGVQTTISKGIIQLAEKIATAGPLLVVAKGKRECEKLALTMKDWLKENGRLKQLTAEEKNSEILQRLDSRLEREMYRTVEMRNLITCRIAYHHAGLPPRVRAAVEEAIREGLIDYVFATTTLAEGVNFPFSSVIVQSLALKDAPSKGRPSRYHPVTPRTFWNIAGRAGRPGHDKEGQAILFEPSLGLEKVNAVIGNYLDPSLKNIAPVKSALGESIKEITTGIKSGEVSPASLEQAVLPESLPKNMQGTINLLRVGLIHAKASKFLRSPEEIIEGSFAAQFLKENEKKIARKVVASQAKVIDEFLEGNKALPIEMIAELGISIETLSLFQQYVKGLNDWQIKNLHKMMRGGRINFEIARYVIGPVAKNMAELEGPKLGGFLSDIIIQWLSGVPLAVIHNAKNKDYFKRLEDLISVIYSRIQYLLPWGFYAVDSLMEEEAKARNIQYANELRSLAYLSDAGVPSFDALRLVNNDFERVDATRLAEFYQRKGGLNQGVDIIGWLLSQSKSTIERCVAGIDNRRLDYDLYKLLETIKA